MLVTFTLQQKTSKNKTKTKKMQPYDREFVVKKNKSLQIHYDSNPWKRPVASVAKMEQ